MPTDQLFDIISSGGVVGVLTVIVVGALKEWWVPGKVHRRVVTEKDFWRSHALKSTNLAEAAIRLAEPTEAS